VKNQGKPHKDIIPLDFTLKKQIMRLSERQKHRRSGNFQDEEPFLAFVLKKPEEGRVEPHA
jgi:hypothetical protein